MNYYYMAFLSITKRFCYASCAFFVISNAYVVVNYHASSSTCAGSEVSCRGNSLNSVGDLVEWNTKGVKVIGYGEISDKTRSVSAVIPKNSKKVILSFIPTKVPDSIKGSMIRVLFVFIPLNNVDAMDLPKSVIHDIERVEKNDPTARTVISVFRQIIVPKSISNNSEWINITTLGTTARSDEIKTIKADLSPDGIATVFTRDEDGKDLPTIINLAMEY